MQTKMLELRDRHTLIPVLAIQLRPGNEAERWLLARAGYGKDADAQAKYILLCRLVGDECGAHYGPHHWKNRTMVEGHCYIVREWEALASGDVVDVQYALGESASPKRSERLDVI
jgi:hypothetical protein